MRTFIFALKIWAAIFCVSAAVVVYFAAKAKPYPCDACGVRPATKDLEGQGFLCEACYESHESRVRESEPAHVGQ